MRDRGFRRRRGAKCSHWRNFADVASASDGAKVVVQVLGDVSGAAAQTRESAENVLSASQAMEAAAAELRREVESFLAHVAA